MKISKYLNISRIKFIVTASCTGRCRHCSFIDRVEGKALDGYYSVIKEKAVELIEKLSKYFEIDSVMTFGGEPLLYPETVAAIHKKAAECGNMPYTDKLTNITSLSLEPNGDLIACAFKIGNIYKESIEEILCRYDPYENRLMRVLTDGCAADLLSYIAENRIDIYISGAQNICDICRKLNKYCDLK